MPLIFLSIGASFAADLNQENEFLSSENNYNDSIESSSISLNNTESFQTNILEDSSKINTVINSNNLIKHYKNNSQFQIELKDTNGLPLANMTIFFTIQGTTYSKNTTENGIAILNINLGPGNYNIISSFRGNDNYNSYSVNNTISVLSLIEGNDLFKYYK
ncbi:Ig-like domain-containing protein, partial [Methanobrevibacter sp. OttesenSCG-928-I08]|nr:Ig-like domain-containing protein [Methanobrevibacter sp. OttesenSCG-928-I08]